MPQGLLPRPVGHLQPLGVFVRDLRLAEVLGLRPQALLPLGVLAQKVRHAGQGVRGRVEGCEQDAQEEPDDPVVVEPLRAPGLGAQAAEQVVAAPSPTFGHPRPQDRHEPCVTDNAAPELGLSHRLFTSARMDPHTSAVARSIIVASPSSVIPRKARVEMRPSSLRISDLKSTAPRATQDSMAFSNIGVAAAR